MTEFELKPKYLLDPTFWVDLRRLKCSFDYDYKLFSSLGEVFLPYLVDYYLNSLSFRLVFELTFDSDCSSAIRF